MKIVIDIPKEIYTHLLERYKYQNIDDIGLCELDKVGVSVKNGTPLPKHGRLIDEQQIIDRFKPVEEFEYWRIGLDGLINVLSDEPTIIEADKESEE